MKDTKKVSILELIHDHFNPKENEESKSELPWDYLHKEAEKLFTKKNKLIKGAIDDADQHSFDRNTYKKILDYLKDSQYKSFTDDILREYNKGNIEMLLENKKINGLATTYSNNKNNIPIHKLLLLNPGVEFTEENSETTFQSKTTFAHKLFENNVPKEDILYFFGQLDNLSSKNPDLIQDYLSLSDENGRSVTAILQEKSRNERYSNIFSDIKRLYPRLYKLQNYNNILINAHTSSVHESVDKSFASLALIYDPESIIGINNERVVSVERNEAWKQKINGDILELEQRLIDLTTSDNAIAKLVDTTISLGEHKDELCSKFKFQAEAALRMVQGLQSGRYGNDYSVNANQRFTGGLTTKEMLAIGYASLKNRDLWKNNDKETQQFMYFIENLYIAKRGYNIDRNGEDEWRTHGTEADYNKCIGATINQIAYGLTDHTLVSVEIKNADTILPILSKRLKDDILNDISQNENHKDLIITWLNGGLLSNNLMYEILTRLKNDTEFTAEFTELEINQLGRQALNKLNKHQLKEIKHSLPSLPEILAKTHNNLLDSAQIHNFAFDVNEGYVLALEKLYNVNRDAFNKTFHRELELLNPLDTISLDTSKVHLIIELLLNSQKREMVHEVKKMLQSYINTFNRKQQNQYLILMAELNNVYMLKTLLECGVTINAQDTRKEHHKYTALFYAIKDNNINLLKTVIDAGADINSQVDNVLTPLHFAIKKRNTEVIKLLIDAGANINFQANNVLTPLHFAITKRNTEAIKLLIDAGVNINCRDVKKNTALHLLSMTQNIEAVKLLINAGADINIKNELGYTALDCIISNWGDIEIIKLLIDAGADINSKANNGYTGLHDAIVTNNIEAMKLLIDAGASINSKANNGCTPLHDAVIENNIEAMKLLIDAGANINIQNNNGETVFNIASNNPEIQKLLNNYLLLQDYKNQIMKSLDTISDNIDLSVFEEAMHNQLAMQLKPEIVKLASSNLGFHIGKIISYFPENLRFEYFKDVVIESTKTMDEINILSMLQPFNQEDRVFLYNELNAYKKKISQEENIRLENINFTFINPDINNSISTTAIEMQQASEGVKVNVTPQAQKNLSSENKEKQKNHSSDVRQK